MSKAEPVTSLRPEVKTIGVDLTTEALLRVLMDDMEVSEDVVPSIMRAEVPVLPCGEPTRMRRWLNGLLGCMYSTTHCGNRPETGSGAAKPGDVKPKPQKLTWRQLWKTRKEVKREKEQRRERKRLKREKAAAEYQRRYWKIQNEYGMRFTKEGVDRATLARDVKKEPAKTEFKFDSDYEDSDPEYWS
ncbi:hypothetical protein HDE_08740 [Halotydeus destructor]|nr:hypothetical protein HDE_08740 [Halotydeus destructor]